ncbi:Maf family protein [Sphingomicrobium lutaoense]|uniref:Nucleoside triphosphate pyrophosphatase n=1 Tax=Sphingomicrobium lutaoense TaxID=515949 RepID=A0A839Z3Y1_9SPHN|nr:Maf family protein [Sphingomicrobium lutaoense]MBB3764797.1 septum formation protein [Sphingomicrobium lutaoense]
MGLILASASGIRRAMLDQAGLDYRVVPADLPEGAIKAAHVGSVPELARKLAIEKALKVSRSHPSDLVIGSDSIALLGDHAFDKPTSREDAAAHLRRFSGKSLKLISSVALSRGGEKLWSTVDEARLDVRELSESFIADYLDKEWPAVSQCVGVFRFEGPGVLLFEKVEGSYFTILGMPLLPLLGALREQGALPS